MIATKGMVSRKGLAAVLVAMLTALSAAHPTARSDDSRPVDLRFGAGFPLSLLDLPDGQLRDQLLNLPAASAETALRQLQSMSFTASDLGDMRADRFGRLLYEDLAVPTASQLKAANYESNQINANAIVEDTFFLHSNPGAPNVVFLDFDGMTLTGTAWNDEVSRYDAQAYDLDGNPDSFSPAERQAIAEIWHRVAEDFAPFDIDVTTEEPAFFDNRTGHVLITSDADATGRTMPYSGGGGTAYIDVFGKFNYAQYSPALIYYNNLGNGKADFVAESVSHEFGHNLGLSHDGNSNSNGQDATYYSGHGSGLVSWAPIMGAAYTKSVTQWSNGDYDGGNQAEDDLGMIESRLGYRVDDHGNSTGNASALVVDADGKVVSSNPELDPHNLLHENKGIIGEPGDVDFFSFNTGTGDITLEVTPAWDAFAGPSVGRGGNLDVRLRLLDAQGEVIAEHNPSQVTGATIATRLAAGTYYLSVSGVGNPATPYSNYGSRGEYFINGQLIAQARSGSETDTTPPNPDPMGWAVKPQAISPTAIEMTAATAVDDSGQAVKYKFVCVSGGQGCVKSRWQSSPIYVAEGLAPDTEYVFRVSARDKAKNRTKWSPKGKATTPEGLAQSNTVKYFAIGEDPVAGQVNGVYDDTHADDATAESIRELISSGAYAKRYSFLEHCWLFDIGQGSKVTVWANAKSSGSTDGDAFKFEYSTDGGNSFEPLFAVASTKGSNLQSATIAGAPSGNIMIRVIDSNRAPGAQDRDMVLVDQLYIEVEE